MNHHERLKQLRTLLAEQKLDGYIQPMTDPFMGEYVPECFQRLPWLTGFTGSAGTAVVLMDTAAVFTDGRYTIQVAQEVDTKDYACLDSSDVPLENWIAEQCTAGMCIAYDPWLFTAYRLAQIESTLAAHDIALVAIDENPIDALWDDRLAFPNNNIIPHPIKYSGQRSGEKRRALAEQLKAAGCEACILTSSDSVAWLLNIRGSDVPHNPVSLHYAIIYVSGEVDLFTDISRVDAETKQHLGDDIHSYPPHTLPDSLAKLAGYRIWVDAGSAPVWFSQQLGEAGAILHTAADPCVLPKACKNDVEVAGMRDAHIRDGVAMCNFLHWLDNAIENKKTITELSASDKLESFRRRDKTLTDLSFDTISGFGANGAIVHYRAQASTNKTFASGNLYLLDSGGQYLSGTTDITRTLAIGTASDEHKDRFTRVLKGHIALAQVQFPKGTTGSQLDVLARHALWQIGEDYAHGTGHGVGSYLNVHEGPQGISKRASSVALQEGMALSNEPGYYKMGEYGIRIENLVTVVPSATEGFLRFDTLTMAPIDTRLIDTTLLSAEEKAWLNSYHQHVFDTLSPKLEDNVRAWLEEKTKPI